MSEFPAPGRRSTGNGFLIILVLAASSLLAMLLATAWLVSSRRAVSQPASRHALLDLLRKTSLEERERLTQSGLFEALSPEDFEAARLGGLDRTEFPDLASEVSARASLGRQLLSQGESAEAARSLCRAYDLARGAWGGVDPYVGRVELEYARALVAEGALESARAILGRRLRDGGDPSIVAVAEELLSTLESGR